MLYLQNEVTKINERKKETHKEKYGGILISGISLLQNSEVALLWRTSYFCDNFLSMFIWRVGYLSTNLRTSPEF